MRRILAYGLVVVLMAANVSKWQMQVGLRIDYYVLPLALWCAVALGYLGARTFHVQRQVKVVLGLKAGFLGAVVLSIPVALLSTNPELPSAILKGGLANAANVIGIILITLVVTRMNQDEREIVLDGYLAVVLVCALYTVAQGVAAYLLQYDLDQVVSGLMPFASADPASVAEDVWSELGIEFYRLTGLTGDPNLNAAVYLVAFPVAFHRMQERPFLARAVILLGLAVVAQSLSVTVLPASFIVLALLGVRYGLRTPASVAATMVLVAGLAVVGWMYVADPFGMMLARRLGPGGTGSQHLQIAADALRLWTDHPYGLGINGFALMSPDFSTHNSYVQRLVELGIPGLVVTVGAVCYSLLVSVARWRGFGFIAALSVAGLAVAAMGHDVLNRFELEAMTYVLVAMALTGRPRVPANQPAQGRERAGQEALQTDIHL